MKRKYITLLLILILVFSAIPCLPAFAESDSLTPLTLNDGTAVAGKANTYDVPIRLSFSTAKGIDLNIRLNAKYVESAEMVRPSAALGGSLYTANQNGAKLKIAIAATAAITTSETLFYLRLTLLETPAETDELCKILQVKVNERITWQASDCILLSGVEDGKIYRESVRIFFNEGSATLNGASLVNGTTVTAEGNHTLRITDNNGKVRTVRFTIDRTPPVITILPYSTEPAQGPLTVQATVNEGALNVTSYTFEANGSFTFVAVDAAGNRSEKVITVTHLIEFIYGDANADGVVNAKDLLLLRQYVANYDYSAGTSTIEVKAGADANGDGTVNAKDLLLLRQYVANYDYATGESTVVLGPKT